ncbi:hypothetical protein BLNAU_19994 [Blattamonas nauphoetae]|uniref:Uncharacterized protein n=1 Tax=Blattamonas nauphoetae TaxID=2049346 RepID=A0ABQ9WZZ5_9EUKA|nr:hypothetical protein BLNAU_19994 [Blattamonas nauphoetae]
MTLSPTDMNHAARFLKYADMHTRYRRSPHNELLVSIFPEDKRRQTKLVSSLINLLSLPSDTLRTVVLSLFDAGLRKLSIYFTLAMAVTGLLPRIFQILKPHEIPLCNSTMELHCHLASMLDNLFTSSNPEEILWHLRIHKFSTHDTQLISDDIEPTFTPLCTYLRYLITTPVSPTGHCSGFTLLWTKDIFRPCILGKFSRSSSLAIRTLFGEIKKGVLEALVSLLGLTSRKAEKYLHTDKRDSRNINSWIKEFDYLLVQVGEGRQISDLGMLAIVCFIYYRPADANLFFRTDDTFGFKLKNRIISPSELDTKSLIALFTPTQPHHAMAVLTVFDWFRELIDNTTLVKHFWNKWFPHFVNAVDPSKMPFTLEFVPLHAKLVKLLSYHLSRIRWCDPRPPPNGPEEIYLAFHKQTKDYVLHLSLHPFALDDEDRDPIIEFLSCLFLYNCKHDMAASFREEVKLEMDAAALSSSSPPFILTSELVCRLTDEKIVNIVDRIVSLLNSDASLDDETILRICAFFKTKLCHVYLPELFRTAGRTTQQYFHTFESLLSLHTVYVDRRHINSLLSSRADEHEPTFDEWDDVDLATVEMLMPMTNPNDLSLASDSDSLTKFILDFVVRSLPQARHSATRLNQPQLERLIAPSIDLLCRYFIQPREFKTNERLEGEKIFIDVCRLCDQRVIAQCLTRLGFFSRFVTGLLHETLETCESFLFLISDRGEHSKTNAEDQNTLQRALPCFLEEGWQDALDFLFVQGRNDYHFDLQDRTRQAMQYFGANLNWLGSWR